MALGEHPRIPVAGEPEPIIKNVVIRWNVEIRDLEKLRMLDPGFLQDAAGNPEGMFTMSVNEQLQWAISRVLVQALQAAEDLTGVHGFGGSVTVLRESDGWVEGINVGSMPPKDWDGVSQPPDWSKVPFES